MPVALGRQSWPTSLVMSQSANPFGISGTADPIEMRCSKWEMLTETMTAPCLVSTFAPDLAPILWALWVPVPALVVRRIRTIGLSTMRADAPKLVFGAAAVGVMGAVVFDLPIWFGVITIGPSILMLYLMFRQGPMEHAFLSPAWDLQR
jgi:hypothetical protein